MNITSDFLNIAHQNLKNGFKNLFSLKDFKPDLEYFLIDLIIMQEEIRMKRRNSNIFLNSKGICLLLRFRVHLEGK